MAVKRSEEFNYLTEDEDLKEAVHNANRVLAGVHQQFTKDLKYISQLSDLLEEVPESHAAPGEAEEIEV